MLSQKSFAYLGTLAVALCVELLTISPAASQIRAQSIQISLTFPPTQSRGAPARTIGGGVRGPKPCFTGNHPLTAITPRNNVVTTVAANPTLFWYVPQTDAKLAYFVLFDQDFNEIYRTKMAVQGTPGIMKLSLPASVSLKTGEAYTWRLAPICDPGNLGGEKFLEGVIERTQLNAQENNQLASVTEPLQKAEIYAKAQIWQETLSIITQLRSERPNDSKVNQAWQELLKSVELDQFATEPIIECCTISDLGQ